MALIITDLALRFESDSGLADNGSYVTTWTDQVDSHVLSQTGQPPLSSGTPTGEAAVDFLGGSDKLDRGNTAVPNMPGADDARTMFMVWKNNGTGRGGFEYGIQAAGRSFGLGIDAAENFTILSWNNDEASATTAVGAGWVVQSVRYDGAGNWAHYIDGAQIDSGSGQSYDTNTAGSSDMRMGVEISNGNNVACEIAALLCYDAELSLADHTEMVDYLTAKYISTVTTLPLDAALSGSVAMAATVERTARAVADLNGAVAISVDADRTAKVSAALSGSVVMSATASKAETVQLDAALSASVAMAATADRTAKATAALSGSVAMSVTAQRTGQTSAALTGAVTMAATVELSNLLPLSAALTGQIGLTATAGRTAHVSGALTGAVALGGTAARTAKVSAALSGAVTMSATVERGGEQALTAALTGSVAMTATVVRTARVSADLNGAATLSATADRTAKVSASLPGSVAMSATVAVTDPPLALDASLAGAVAMTATVVRTPKPSASLVASISMAVAAARTAKPSSALTASVSMAATIDPLGVVAVSPTTDWAGMVAWVRATERESANRRRTHCPNDGWPLDDVNGVLHCGFDGWTDRVH